MKVQSTEIKNKPSLIGCVAKSGLVTALTSSIALPEITKANMRNSILGEDVFTKLTRKSAEKTAEFLSSTQKSPNLDFSKVTDKLGKFDIDAVVAKAKEKYPEMRKQGLKALGVLTAITAVNALVMFTLDKIAAKKANAKTK